MVSRQAVERVIRRRDHIAGASLLGGSTERDHARLAIRDQTCRRHPGRGAVRLASLSPTKAIMTRSTFTFDTAYMSSGRKSATGKLSLVANWRQSRYHKLPAAIGC